METEIVTAIISLAAGWGGSRFWDWRTNRDRLPVDRAAVEVDAIAEARKALEIAVDSQQRLCSLGVDVQNLNTDRVRLDSALAEAKLKIEGLELERQVIQAQADELRTRVEALTSENTELRRRVRLLTEALQAHNITCPGEH